MRSLIPFFVITLFIGIGKADALVLPNRWKLSNPNSISWKPAEDLPHHDHIELSGKYISAVIRYGVNEDFSFSISRDIVWPMLRTIPNNTHASLVRTFDLDPVKLITINKQLVLQDHVNEIILNGKITVKSSLTDDIQLVRTLFPSTSLPLFGEKYELTNTGNKTSIVEIPEINILTRTNPTEGVDGSYSLSVQSTHFGTFVLHRGETIRFYLSITGTKNSQDFGTPDMEKELSHRDVLLSEFNENLILETPDTLLNRAFEFAKIRAAESIYQTRGGPLHGPGGLSYYAAIWANDQAEYINPFFPYLGYSYGIESGVNAYRHFARFMNPEYHPIPSSIIAEGTDTWHGAGDRGDAAMIAYGASRFALALGNRDTAEKLWPLIEWCLEYNKRKLNPQGVVSSKSDELEGRFPSGTANLCTSSLYYDALVSASCLGQSLKKNKKQILGYKTEAKVLKNNIGKYFGAKVMGYDTYRYYEGNEKLRAWICMPLTVNIFDRKQATIDALFSPELWTDDGLASQAGDKTFWDRSTLYALRGVFAAGETKRGLKYLKYYSNRRLLGEHVPYPVEAYPEGGQRHLSAESGLYCRIYTEGLFGIRPVALNSFTITPQLPEEWNFMRIKKVHGFQKEFDIDLVRDGKEIRVTITCGSKIVFNKKTGNGITHTIKL